MLEVLLVDNSPSMIEMITSVLEQSGYRVTPAADGEAALQIVKGLRYDAMVTELVLPGMSGLELIRDIRLRDNTIPIVVLSDVDSIERAVEVMREGADDFVQKGRGDLKNVLPFAVDRTIQRRKREMRFQVFDAVLPICAYCKKVRHLQDKEYVWISIERYFEEKKAGLNFSHGVCTDCLKKLSREDKKPSSSGHGP